MGTFDSSSDIPNQIKTEGQEIVLKFSPGKPQGGGTVEWNIPAPALGCASDTPGAYCGIVVLLHTSAFTQEQVPTNSVRYVADATASPDTHAGDRIGDALVIGAFYEGDKKANGLDLTTSFTITDVDPKQSYYVIAHAVDCQGRYHAEGTRAYSAEFGNVTEPGTPGSQTVILNGDQGALPTDATGLIPGTVYEFEMNINPNFPSTGDNRIVKVSEDGLDIATYGQLIDAINKAIALADNPLQSPIAPNAGRYYWDGTGVYQWDGSVHNPVEALIEPTDPSLIAAGSPPATTYWNDTTNDQLKVYNAGWNDVTTLEYPTDPTQLSGEGHYWFDGTQAYGWCSNTWCELLTHVTNVDPSLPAEGDCGTYWFDTVNETLTQWDVEGQTWVPVFAISWESDPSAPATGSPASTTYWYDDTNSELYAYGGSPLTWIAATHTSSDEEPLLPIDDDLWYNPDTEDLKRWDDADAEWLEQPVIVWPTDPRDRNSCELWWDTTSDQLFKWDSVHSQWDVVSSFTQSEIDPLAPPVLGVDEMWWNTDGDILYRWNGVAWETVTYMVYPTDPTMPVVGDVWHDTTNDTWNEYVGASPIWDSINPIDSATDPSIIDNGTFWYDTTNDILYERQGTTWIATPVSTTPYYPTYGDLWFDTSTDTLKEWVRTTDDPASKEGEWIDATPLAAAEIDSNGNLTISTTGTGTENMIMILVPEGTSYGTYEGIATGHAGTDTFCCQYGQFDGVNSPPTSVTADQFVFDFLVPPGVLIRHTYGSDAVSSLPTYDQIGVGDDGSVDERREIADWIRSELGYPSVEVELTKKQIDNAIDMAIETIRQRTSIAYQRNFFFLDVKPGYQHYKLTDRVCGFHKIVTVTSAHRMTSAFLSSAHGSGVYGQVVLQHLYNMGTFDLLSYHLVSEYVEQMEHLFATRLVFHWNEHERVLAFYQSFSVRERILLDVMIEQPEQFIMKDRWARPWVKRFALMKGMENLAQIRGKFATLPGAGGGVSLNAADLMSRAAELREELEMEIDEYIVNDVEDIGMHSTMILG